MPEMAEQRMAAAVEGAAVHALPEVLYLQRVCADEHGLELIDGGLDSSCAAFNDRFAPSRISPRRFRF